MRQPKLRRPSTPKHQPRIGFETLEPRHLLAVVINEIHYDPNVATEQVEFIELYNSGASAVDLSNWILDEAVDYTFPVGSSIAAGGYLVVTQNASDFATKYGFAAFGQWQDGDRLSNDGESIELFDASGTLVDIVSYRPGFPWPTTGDYGSSLELIHPDLDNDLAGSWRSSGLSSTPNGGQDLVASGESWRYRKGIVTNPPTNPGTPAFDWRSSGFVEANDSVAWQSGVATIGYGDGDDVTVLADMQNNYSTVYLRKSFNIEGAVPNHLELRIYLDDGAIVTINGVEVSRHYMGTGSANYNSLSQTDHEAEWETVLLTNASSYLVQGVNTIAVHLLNSNLASSDLSFNLQLSVPDDTISQPTPGAVNTVYSTNAAPQLRQLNQSIAQPQSGEDVVVSIKATDPNGVAGVTLAYQIVLPGNYIRITDAAYETNWTTLVMRDDGLAGDAVAGDDVYSVTLPGSLQNHRSMVRYRITATDTLGASVQGPYADDPQPNFAYFVYDGVPDYSASLRPGQVSNVVYSGDKLDDIATYHLIANPTDVQNSQYNGQYNEVLFRGTLVYNGVVYDHVEFRNRGQASTYQVGKNKWKIEFLTGHHFQAYDNYGKPYNELWDEINILPGTNPWWRNDVSTEGTVLFEPAAFKLFELAGAPSPRTNYFNFRVIDGASETGANQFAGDFWGLYIGIEQPDGSFLDERGLDDGNIYNMHSGVWGATTQRHQGPNSPTDRSDLTAFVNGTDGGFESLQWWQENLNWDVYFAWNIVNHLVNNSDIRPNENVNYYRNEVTGQWYVIPWDLDLTFEDAPHHGQPVTTRENIRSLLSQHPSARLAYNNRLREITDLLLNSGDAAQVIAELAGVLTLGTGDLSIVNANQAMWDYHPQKNKKGIWYENFNPALLSQKSFAGLVDYMQDFVGPGGYGYNLVQGQGNDTGVPTKPTISYTGTAEFPVDELAFETSTFSDPQGPGTFAAMEWRIAEVYNAGVANYVASTPYIYEIEGTWESGTLSSFDSQLDVPSTALEAGKTYRARVRMQDASGNWSHWSDPIELLAAPPSEQPTLAITELNYNPASAGPIAGADLEFIEIWNYGDNDLDLSGYQIADFANTPYVFASGTILAAGQFIVIARSPEIFQSHYGTSINLAANGYFDANFSNGGETVTLRTPSGLILQSLTYSDGDGWPTAADGGGPSLEIIDPLGDLNDPANWRTSATVGGTPGKSGIAVPQLAGDYDNSGTVDAADYTVWKQYFGASLLTLGAGPDGNGDGLVNLADYTIWRDNLGATLPPPVAVVVSPPAEEDTANDEALATLEDESTAIPSPASRAWMPLASPSTDASEVDTASNSTSASSSAIDAALLLLLDGESIMKSDEPLDWFALESEQEESELQVTLDTALAI
ncbi:lamin tail domain-containing protein [Aeoliella sp. SH292]|uniref:lamin tail domain-containing protein n=1 Tax=Aeoliella sp. SH292 TaxID=3454464 RepID=UPI003F973E49